MELDDKLTTRIEIPPKNHFFRLSIFLSFASRAKFRMTGLVSQNQIIPADPYVNQTENRLETMVKSWLKNGINWEMRKATNHTNETIPIQMNRDFHPFDVSRAESRREWT